MGVVMETYNALVHKRLTQYQYAGELEEYAEVHEYFIDICRLNLTWNCLFYMVNVIEIQS
jgi:hypothetical protein